MVCKIEDREDTQPRLLVEDNGLFMIHTLFSDLHAIDLPVPYSVKTVNVVVSTSDPVTLIDTGIHSDASLHGLKLHFAELGIALEDVEHVVLTHHHSDHMGLAGYLQMHYGVTVSMLKEDILHAQNRHARQALQEHWAHLGHHGLPKEAFPTEQEWEASGHETWPCSEIQPLKIGDPIPLAGQNFQVLHLPGHTDGHLGLWNPEMGFLISGDVLLQNTTPHIGCYADSNPDPILDHLRSLDQIERLGPQQIVPGHFGFVIEGSDISDCIRHTRKRHQNRMERLESQVAGQKNQTAFEYSQKLFPRAVGASKRSALVTTIAYLEHLRLSGKIARHFGEGTWKYHPC